MSSKIQKIKDYYKDNGFKETVKKVYRVASFKLKVKNPSKSNTVYKLSKKEEQQITKKTEKKVYIFTNIPYFDVGGGQRAAQLAKTFNNMGYLVEYYYAFNSSETVKHSMLLPVTVHKRITKINNDEFASKIDKNSIFIFEAPMEMFLPYLNIAVERKSKIIYENIDNWETSLGNMFFSEKALREFLEKSTVLVGTAKLLVEQLKDYLKKYQIPEKKIMYLPNAVDSDLFEPRKKYEKPQDLVTGSKTLIYYGSLWGSWFDWELIEKVAKSCKDISINLIGDYAGIMEIVKKMPDNIHFLGLKKQTDLPSYLYYSDYAILPFKPDEIGKYVSPLKLFEYIAMNKPVIATTLEDIVQYENVYSSNNSKDWINWINNGLDFDIEARNNFISNNDWYSRISKMIDSLETSKKCDLEFYDNISIIILNYNNINVIENCIDSILRYNERYKVEIVVVDNQSKDGSYEMLEQKYNGKIKLLKNSKNGCSSGRNLGVKNATKDYIMFLDSDQWILHKYWLEPYIEILNKNTKIGALGWAAGWLNKEGYSYHVVDSFPYKYMPPIGLYRCDIGYLGTGGMILKRELFNKIDGFDLHYDPTCYEDTDLSLKVRNEGLEIAYTTYLGVGHLPHQTTKSGSKEHDKLIKSKGDYFIQKWKKINPKLLKYIK